MRIAIHGLGRIVTGDVTAPIADGGTITIADGLIESVGQPPTGSFDVEIDARGATAVPGLIDSHVHLAFGDFTPRQNTVGYLASYVHGGVTTVLSASEVHVPGRPTTATGLVALAVAAHQSYEHYRPGGMHAHGGSLILDPVLGPDDFAAARVGGVWLCKAGFGAVETPLDYVDLVRTARHQGMVTTLHVGGASIPGSSPVTGDDVLAIDPHVAFHCNGGPVAMADADYDKVLTGSTVTIQLCTAGNLRTLLAVARSAAGRGEWERIVLGTDTPTGSGVMPLGLWYTISQLASLGGIDPAVAIAWGTGNTADTYGLSCGRIRVGADGDIVLIDAPLGAAHSDPLDSLVNGDIVGIGAVITDGAPRFVGRSRNSPPPSRLPVVVRNEIRHDFATTAH